MPCHTTRCYVYLGLSRDDHGSHQVKHKDGYYTNSPHRCSKFAHRTLRLSLGRSDLSWERARVHDVHNKGMGWHAVPQVWQRRRQRVCQDHAHAIRHEHIRQGQSSWDGRTNTGDTGRERRAARQYRVVLHCHCMHAACTNVEPAPCRRSEQSTMVTVPALPHGCLPSQANTLGYTMRYYDASIWDETGEGAHGGRGWAKAWQVPRYSTTKSDTKTVCTRSV